MLLSHVSCANVNPVERCDMKSNAVFCCLPDPPRRTISWPAGGCGWIDRPLAGGGGGIPCFCLLLPLLLLRQLLLLLLLRQPLLLLLRPRRPTELRPEAEVAGVRAHSSDLPARRPRLLLLLLLLHHLLLHHHLLLLGELGLLHHLLVWLC